MDRPWLEVRRLASWLSHTARSWLLGRGHEAVIPAPDGSEAKDGSMKQILHVLCSPRGRDGESSKLSSQIVSHLLEVGPATTVVERMVGGNALRHVDADYATSLATGTDVSQVGSMAHSE